MNFSNCYSDAHGMKIYTEQSSCNSKAAHLRRNKFFEQTKNHKCFHLTILQCSQGWFCHLSLEKWHFHHQIRDPYWSLELQSTWEDKNWWWLTCWRGSHRAISCRVGVGHQQAPSSGPPPSQPHGLPPYLHWWRLRKESVPLLFHSDLLRSPPQTILE